MALPTLMTDLNTTLPLIAWTLAGYTLAQVALRPAIAKFSDNFGRKRAEDESAGPTAVLEPGR